MPKYYCPIPQRLITGLHDNPRAIGWYALIARLYQITKQPVPLSDHDVVRYDPSASRGASIRARERLLAGGWIVKADQPGLKNHYIPTWGRINDAPLLWQMAAPCLGRPRHIHALRLDQRLFDICMGKINLHATRKATNESYLTTPILSLFDIGCYALTLSGFPHETPALIRIGAVRDRQAQPLPSSQHMLALISQRAMDLDESGANGAALTMSGTRKLGVVPILTSASSTAREQPLFFVPPDQIGILIGSMIGSGSVNDPDLTAPQPQETRSVVRLRGSTWNPMNPMENQSPPPPPPQQDNHKGGGRQQKDDQKAIRQRGTIRRTIRPTQPTLSMPDTTAAQLLRTINVKPAQVAELAELPLTSVESAIADGQARVGIRDLAAWVVSLLRAHRDYGWKIVPPAPPPDSPEALRSAFARLAAEQETAQRTSCGDVARILNHTPAPPTGSPLDIRSLWDDVLAAMQVQVSRQEFNTWIRRAVLQSLNAGIATISVPSAFVKTGLEDRYAGPLRELIQLLAGFPVRLRIVIQMIGRDPVSCAGPPVLVATPHATASYEPGLSPPDWISPAHWAGLPAPLRAALHGSAIIDNQVRYASIGQARSVERCYTAVVAALLAEYDATQEVSELDLSK
jgi:hypothetical protein